MIKPRPTWQESVCPPWCVREHLEDDKDGDRDHESIAVSVPVVRVVRVLEDGGMARSLTAEDVFVLASQEQERRRPYITIGLIEDASVCLELRDESAERLLEALAAVLAQVL